MLIVISPGSDCKALASASTNNGRSGAPNKYTFVWSWFTRRQIEPNERLALSLANHDCNGSSVLSFANVCALHLADRMIRCSLQKVYANRTVIRIFLGRSPFICLYRLGLSRVQCPKLSAFRLAPRHFTGAKTVGQSRTINDRH